MAVKEIPYREKLYPRPRRLFLPPYARAHTHKHSSLYSCDELTFATWHLKAGIDVSKR